MRRSLLVAAAGAAALLWAARARATAYAPEAARTAARLPPEQREERAFLRQAAALARLESEACRLAATRAQSAAVRAWATETLAHHETHYPQLLHLLQARGMAPPMLEAEQRRTLARLAKAQGARFDREFMETLAARLPREKLQQFERAQQAAADPALKAWVERQLPAVRYQLASAERLGSDGRGVVAGRTVRPALVSGSSSR